MLQNEHDNQDRNRLRRRFHVLAGQDDGSPSTTQTTVGDDFDASPYVVLVVGLGLLAVIIGKLASLLCCHCCRDDNDDDTKLYIIPGGRCQKLS